MNFRHPFEWLSKSGQKRTFIILLILTLAVMAALRSFDTHLKTDAAPNGIVSYEFAGTLPAAPKFALVGFGLIYIIIGGHVFIFS